MKKILLVLILIIFNNVVNAAALLDVEISRVQQYGADALTVIYLKNGYTSPHSCPNSLWGNKAVFIRSGEDNAEKVLSVALAAMIANKKVDIGLKSRCDAATESIHYIAIKN